MRSLDDLPPTAAGTTGYLCPVDDCDWFHYEPPVAQPQSTGDVMEILNTHADPASEDLQEAIGSAVGNMLLARTRETEAILRDHFATHALEDFLRTINRLRELADQEPIAEYGQLMAGGGYHVRNPHPDIERIYPLADWIADRCRHGGEVHRRRLIVVEDWAEVTEP